MIRRLYLRYPFSVEGRAFILRPHRTVPFEEATSWTEPKKHQSINAVTSRSQVPTSGGQADYWHLDTAKGQLRRVHKRPRKTTFNPHGPSAQDCPIPTSKLKPKMTTFMVRVGQPDTETVVTEDWRASGSKVNYDHLWTHRHMTKG